MHFLLTVNQLVVGSIPTAGANKIKGLAERLTSFLLPRIIWGHAGDTFFALNRANHPQNSPFTDQARQTQKICISIDHVGLKALS